MVYQSKNYQSVAFRPGFSLQASELNEIQEIEGLENLINLEVLDLSKNNIKEIRNLQEKYPIYQKEWTWTDVRELFS